MSTVSLRPVTEDNWEDCVRLKLPPEQDKMVAPNVLSIAEWHFEPDFIPRAIYAEQTVVGFLMYCCEQEAEQPDIHWLFRFMIGHKFQGNGYGSKALELVIGEMKKAGATDIRTMHHPDNQRVAKMYQRIGFREVGTLDDGDIELQLQK